MSDAILERVPSIFDAAAQVLAERRESYGGQVVDDYMPFGVASYVQMVHLKTARLVSGVKQGLPAHALVDSALDLINYAAFLAAFIEYQAEQSLAADVR